MFDALFRPLIDPPLNRAGRIIARLGVSADHLTLAGAAVGVGAGFAIAWQHYLTGLGLVVLSRLLDGLDGAVARATKPTDFGGYLDIVCDFVFYVAIPIGFGLANPANLAPALVLTASFALTGVSFLAYAVLAEKRGLATSSHGLKSFFFKTGLAEGAETILAFVLMCLLPDLFPEIAWVFAGLCGLTVLQRTLAARAAFRSQPPVSPDADPR
jgi:phosphatidylglycerophosphate synthase